MSYTLVDGLRSGFERVVVVTNRSLRPALEDHLARQLSRDLPVQWCYQELDDLPEDLVHLAASRRKPWGTGQAVLAAANRLEGAFAVANADDWYGPEGGVSRGWIEADDEGRVRRVVELFEVRRGGREGMLGVDPEGKQVSVPPGTPASMNLWGFRPCILPLLREGFRSFLLERGSDDATEYALSTAVDQLLDQGTLSLHLLPEGRRWFGVTHPQDTESVRSRLEALHGDGTYSTPLKDSLPEPED
jgi:dTDP-glucose pyrophosphorylase